MNDQRPEIMAPAGNTASFLAAIAAGADAVYCGLKHFSARMEADNFSLSELARLTELGRKRNCKTYVAMNTLMKPEDVDSAGNLIYRLEQEVGPAALIIQDPGVINLAKQAGFSGELHLSTLANISHQAGLSIAKSMGADRVVVPRELDIDEIKAMSEACPDGLELEAFVHGALCHCVSGRCWWSSYMGGKSGLRGRCVQPCRRLYRMEKPGRPNRPSAKQKENGPAGRTTGPRPPRGSRLFSCMDLGLDVLVRTLNAVPKISAWKIEGRKKGPHYVFYTVSAYRMLRDQGNDPQARKTAQDLLEQALGRPTTHSRFLPQRTFIPMDPNNEMGSGRLIGQVRKGAKGFYSFDVREELIPGDLLRVGFQDDPWHRIVKIRKKVPKRGRYDVRIGKHHAPPKGVNVYLMDRREHALVKLMNGLSAELDSIKIKEFETERFTPLLPKPERRRTKVLDYRLRRKIPEHGSMYGLNIWLDDQALDRAPDKAMKNFWWWLPPVIWPADEPAWKKRLERCLDKGGTQFVLNAPWQMGLFNDIDKKGMKFTAGPFCNIANPLAIKEMAALGFGAAYVSPEMSKEDILALPARSALPLGMVVKGMWPLGISRFKAEQTKLETPIYSPRGEIAWVRAIGPDHWIFPGWELDLNHERNALSKAGYSFFLTMDEFRPKSVPKRERGSTFNWDLKFL